MPEIYIGPIVKFVFSSIEVFPWMNTTCPMDQVFLLLIGFRLLQKLRISEFTIIKFLVPIQSCVRFTSYFSIIDS